MAGLYFLLVFVVITNGDLATRGVDQNIGGLREGRPFLDVVVADETKGTLLGKDGGFVVDRSVLETEDQVGDGSMRVNDLDEVAGCENFALRRVQRKEPWMEPSI